MDIYNVEVRFDEYCPKCKYKDVREAFEPCNTCLENPANCQSEKPVNFEFAKNTQAIMNNN